jgi:hypothetical protein
MRADVEIVAGSHVWRNDGLYVEWSDLSQEQQQEFIKARDVVRDAFSSGAAQIA